MTDPVLPGPRWASKPFVLIILCFNFCPRDRPVQFHFVSSQQLELFLWWNIKYWLAELQAPELTPAAPLLQSPVRPLSEMARFLPHLTAEQLLKKHSLILSVFFPPPASDNISDGTVRPHRLTETDCVLYLYLNTLSYRYFFTILGNPTKSLQTTLTLNAGQNSIQFTELFIFLNSHKREDLQIKLFI